MEKSNELTARQQQILEFIRAYVDEHGYPPTVREIGNEHGIRSPNGVLCSLRAIEKKGAIKVTRRSARGIAIIDHDLPDGDTEIDRLEDRVAVLERENAELRKRFFERAGA